METLRRRDTAILVLRITRQYQREGMPLSV